ncbi:MAG: N-acetyltransferase [Fibrella sp.]|nr:N-acetyltransferase [Armatimonadota bacterium]
MIIREEQHSDIESITRVTDSAFANKAYSSGTESFIIHALRAEGALSLSLVAETDGQIAGHVAFSPVTISDESADWYGLGPVAVLPELQKRGIGKALIREGLNRLRSLGAQGCVLLGDPNYYTRFGFANTPDLILEGFPPEYFLAVPFADRTAQGTVLFHPAFSAHE